MYLQKLSLLNFRNYEEAELLFGREVNCLTGSNGAGKTNILDAIHYLSFCKSYFSASDNHSIRTGESYFMVQGLFGEGGDADVVHCAVKRNQKKLFRFNQKEYEKLADHIGLFPSVIITPNDSVLITEGSEERRKFIDSAISQFDKAYLSDLISYNRIVSQRNALLKQFAAGGRFDDTMMELWNEQMVPLATSIHEKRQAFLNGFNPVFSRLYGFISSDSEKVDIRYDSQLNQSDMGSLLQESAARDRSFQYTTAGVHRDDLGFLIRDMPVKRFGSQGQQKSFLVSLKLALFEYIRSLKNKKPLLLLDDIFDKLDEKRIRKLMELVSNGSFGQIFITDTHTERIRTVFGTIRADVRMFSVENGTVVPA
jgi:DNA replication and repair protein RecF